MRKATSTQNTDPTMSPAVVAAVHAEADRLDRKALSKPKRKPKGEPKTAQARRLAGGITSTSENSAKSTLKGSDSEYVSSTEMKGSGAIAKTRTELHNLARTLLSSLVQEGTSGVKSLQGWVEDSSDVQEKKGVRFLIDKIKSGSADPSGKDISGTIGTDIDTYKKPTTLLERILNSKSTSEISSHKKSKKPKATDMAPSPRLVQTEAGGPHASSASGADNSTAPESQEQSKPSLSKKNRRLVSARGRISRRLSTLRIRRIAAKGRNVIRRIVAEGQKVISSISLRSQSNINQKPSRPQQDSRTIPQTDGLERPASATELIPALSTHQTLRQALLQPHPSRPKGKYERAKSVEGETLQKTLKADIKQIDAADLSIARAYIGLNNLVLLKLTSR